MTLAERLRARATKLRERDARLREQGIWRRDLEYNAALMEEAANAMTPKPWPPPVGTPRVLGIWDADEGEGLLDTYYWDDRWPPPVPDRWLPWPEGGDE